jgi:hypothetical protein
MANPTDTETREMLNAITALAQRVEVGFAQIDAKVDIKFAELSSKIDRVEAKADIKFAELSSKIDRVEAKADIKFAELSAKGDKVEGKLDTKIAELGGKIDVLNERTSIGFWNFIGRGLLLSIFGALALAAISFAIYGVPKMKL